MLLESTEAVNTTNAVSRVKEAVNVYYCRVVQANSSMFTRIPALYVGLRVNDGRKPRGQGLSSLQGAISKGL